MRSFHILSLCSFTLLLQSCLSTGSNNTQEMPPEIYANMPIEKAIDAGIQFGGPTLRDVKKLIKRRNLWNEAAEISYQRLISLAESDQRSKKINTMQLYMLPPRVKPVDVFQTMAMSEDLFHRRLGFQLAALEPDAKMKKALESVLTRSVINNQESLVLVPEMANAVVTHNLKSVYTLVRLGLFQTGKEEFAAALSKLNPEEASNDLMGYLALAPANELRQMTLASVNVYTCIMALKHLQKNPVPLSHPGFKNLFLFTVSRNPVLAESAQKVLDNYLPEHKDHLAFMLSRFDPWVQIAYLESAKRKMTPKVGLLINELKGVTAQREIIEEINEIRR